MSGGSVWTCNECHAKNKTKHKTCATCYQPKSDGSNVKYPSLKKPPKNNNILKRGPLQKKGKGMFDGWSTRYFILKKDADFAYYTDEACRNWKGNIDLQTVTKIERKDNRNIILHTPKRKWFLLSHSQNDMDHWQQLIQYTVATEQNRKKKKMHILKKPRHAPPPKPQLTQSQSAKTWAKNPAPQNNINMIHSFEEGDNINQNAHQHPQLYLPAFNPEFIDDNKEEKNEPIDDNEPIQRDRTEYYDEGVNAAYLSKDINITETTVYKLAYLCIWRIAKPEMDDNNEDSKETLQILMGTNKNKLCFFGGDKIISDYGPIDCALRYFKVQTAAILSDEIYDQIKQSLSISNERQMFWGGQQTRSATYFYNMDYDYEMIDTYNEDYSGTDDNLYFDKLYWVHWEDIYKYTLLHSNPKPIDLNDKVKCDINNIVCQIIAVDDIVSYFHDIITKYNNNKNNEVEDMISEHKDNIENNNDDIFDPYGIATAPKLSVYSGTNIVSSKQYKWQWFDGDTKFEDFDSESNEKIEHSFLVNPKEKFFITVNNIKYKINLKDSTQTNTKSNTVRLLRRVSTENVNINIHKNDEYNNYSSTFASNGNMLSYNPQWKNKHGKQNKSQKKKNEMTRYQYMNKDGEWVDYGKELSMQIQISSLQNSKYVFTNNKGEECEINFQLMEQTNKTNNNQIYPIRKINIEQHVD